MRRWYPHDINFSFLLGVIRFWDPEDHVFRFNLDELCPTTEEFSYLLDQDMTCPLAAFQDMRSPRVLLAGYLGLPESHCWSMIVGGLLHLEHIVRYFLQPSSYRHVSPGRISACVLCALSQMLLVTGDAILVDPLVLQVVIEGTSLRLVTPIILDETLNGLNALSRGETDHFRGSPYLLYIWLSEHFSLISFDDERLLRFPGRFFKSF